MSEQAVFFYKNYSIKNSMIATISFATATKILNFLSFIAITSPRKREQTAIVETTLLYSGDYTTSGDIFMVKNLSLINFANQSYFRNLSFCF